MDLGVKIEREGKTGYASPLFWAAVTGMLDVVKILAENGAKLNILDHSDRTPFDVAAQFNQHDVANYLATKMQIPTSESLSRQLFRSDPTRPLPDINIIDRYIEQGADVNYVDSNSGVSLLSKATNFACVTCKSNSDNGLPDYICKQAMYLFTKLLKNGADPDGPTSGFNLFQFTKNANCPKVYDLLLAHRTEQNKLPKPMPKDFDINYDLGEKSIRVLVKGYSYRDEIFYSVDGGEFLKADGNIFEIKIPSKSFVVQFRNRDSQAIKESIQTENLFKTINTAYLSMLKSLLNSPIKSRTSDQWGCSQFGCLFSEKNMKHLFCTPYVQTVALSKDGVSYSDKIYRELCSQEKVSCVDAHELSFDLISDKTLFVQVTMQTGNKHHFELPIISGFENDTNYSFLKSRKWTNLQPIEKNNLKTSTPPKVNAALISNNGIPSLLFIMGTSFGCHQLKNAELQSLRIEFAVGQSEFTDLGDYKVLMVAELRNGKSKLSPGKFVISSNAKRLGIKLVGKKHTLGPFWYEIDIEQMKQ